MNHIIFIYLILTIIISFANLAFSFYLKVLKKSEYYSNYFIFVLTLFIDNLSSMFFNYIIMNKILFSYVEVFNSIDSFIDILCLSGYLYFGRKLIVTVFDLNILNIKKLHFIISLNFLFYFVLQFFTNVAIASTFPKAILYLIILYSVIRIIINSKEMKLYLCGGLVLLLVLLENLQRVLPLFPYDVGGFFGPTLFVTINVVLLKDSINKYLFNSSEKYINKKLKENNLTNREMDIAIQVLKGLSNKEISNELYISEGTVKNYVYSIFNKFNIKSRIQFINLFNMYKN